MNTGKSIQDPEPGAGHQCSPPAHGIKREVVEEAGLLLAVVVSERGDKVRVVTACYLDAGQKRE